MKDETKLLGCTWRKRACCGVLNEASKVLFWAYIQFIKGLEKGVKLAIQFVIGFTSYTTIMRVSTSVYWYVMAQPSPALNGPRTPPRPPRATATANANATATATATATAAATAIAAATARTPPIRSQS